MQTLVRPVAQDRCSQSAWSEPCQRITSLGEATIPADANTGQAPDCAHKRGIRLQAQLRLAHGSLRDPTLMVLGAQGRKNNRRKHWICAKLTKTAGHQMAGIIQNFRRKPWILRGKSHRGIGDFMGVNSLILRPILEGPPAHNPYCWRTDLTDTGIQARGRRRSLPIRPYLHARITRITSVEQLPQIINDR